MVPPDGSITYPAPSTLPTGGLRGTALFSASALDRIIQDTILPETGPDHTVAVVASTTPDGIQAGILFRKQTAFGDWKVEAAWTHTWAGDDVKEAKLVWAF